MLYVLQQDGSRRRVRTSSEGSAYMAVSTLLALVAVAGLVLGIVGLVRANDAYNRAVAAQTQLDALQQLVMDNMLTLAPSNAPSASPTASPTPSPTMAPTLAPTLVPTAAP